MIKRKLTKLSAAMRMRGALWQQIRDTLSEQQWRDEHIPFLSQETPESVLSKTSELHLVMPSFRNGNVSPVELVMLAALTNRQRPKVCLEIGTFNGNTTLQIAANSPPEARIFTLDLPLENAQAPTGIAQGDTQFIESGSRQKRRFVETKYASMITELLETPGRLILQRPSAPHWIWPSSTAATRTTT